MGARFHQFFSDESGQATTEYILGLVVAVSLFFVVKRGLEPIFTQMREKLVGSIDRGLFPGGAALHQLRVGR